jgi:polyhydroxybutyrate depolymerase
MKANDGDKRRSAVTDHGQRSPGRWGGAFTVLRAFLLAAACACAHAPSGDGRSAATEEGAQERTLFVASGGRERSVLLHVPPGHDSATPAMLVLNFHGITMTAEEQAALSGMSAVADAHDFLVAYPSGIGKSWNAGPSCCGDAQSQNIDDVLFVRDVLDTIGLAHAVDPKRIFATGMSNGAFFTHRLGCELADRIAAIAPVAGVLGDDPAKCHPARPVSVLDFHGTSDVVVPYDGWGSFLFGFVTAPATVNAWRALDHCGEPTALLRRGDTTCIAAACEANAGVTFCSIDGGGHSWPGSRADDPSNVGPVSSYIDASAMIYDFFRMHGMP